MGNLSLHKIFKILQKKLFWFFWILFFVVFHSTAQNAPKVTSTIDSTKILIGEQINFTVDVEVDTTAQVVFPEAKAFLPLEVIESYPVDTSRNKDRYNLIKKYALTQFDSGSYMLPRQQILVNNTPFFTDSIQIDVNTVLVDTTKQKMYDIKPIIAVEKNYSGWLSYLWWFLGIAIVGSFVYWFFFRKKPLSEEEKVALLPPFDRAMLELKKLEESKYLIQSEHKQYYSELTNIVRAYIEEDVHISALESTTDELIQKIEMLKDSGALKIEKETIKQFQQVLKTADLVKFAKSKPENNIAEADRKAIEQIVVKTKEGLPEPTEEDLQNDEEYLLQLTQKKRKRKIIIAGAASLLLVLMVTAGAIGFFGFHTVKDTVLGHPTKALLEGEWVASEYGYPPIELEAPEVLKRFELPIPKEAKASIHSNQTFAYGTLTDHFYIMASVTTFNKDVEFDLQKAIDGSIALFEAEGAKNIITKQDKFETLTGKEGIKVYGSMLMKGPESTKEQKQQYTLLSFAENGGFQQLVIVHKDDNRYAQDVVQRILNSINFKAIN
ncbi:hypothetical protein [Leptobacterium sp. I13]|uniref:hypothetical protein n=1 Tax=Leptobacterium meishanense TaxID=3128904 RepID=UPI0030EF6311